MSWLGAIPTNNGTVREVLSPRMRGDVRPRLTKVRDIRSEAHRTAHLTVEELGEEIQECILKCLDCRSICARVVEHCRRLKGANSECPDVRLLLNCSEICATAARFMLRGSEFCQRLCLLCAEVCNSCAGQCSNASDDAEMETCAAAFRQCAECCDRIAGVAAQGLQERIEKWKGC